MHQSARNLTILIPSHSTSFYKKYPIYNMIKLYNKLPTIMKKESNLKTFKKMLKDLLLDKAYYNLNEFMKD